MILLRFLVFLLGLALVLMALNSAIRTLVLPRAASDAISGLVFACLRWLFELPLRRTTNYATIDRVMALYAPVAVLTLLPVWLIIVSFGYMGMYWATGIDSLQEDFIMSGSSLLTLGYAKGTTLTHTLLSFSEATIGLILVALLIAYLPAMYSNFSKRETAVSQLASRAGMPPSAAELILRMHRIGELQQLRAFWREWEVLFSEIEESHTSLPPLAFFRSPNPELSWVTASGVVLDAASLIASTVDVPREPQAELCIRAGFIALHHIAQFFDKDEIVSDTQYPANPISVSRDEYDAVCAQLAAYGVPLKPDRTQTWLAYAGWRVNYDQSLLALCELTMAPCVRWSGEPMEGNE
jgi:hypothetical protein